MGKIARQMRATLVVFGALCFVLSPESPRAAQPTAKVLLIGNELTNGVGDQLKDLYETTGRTATITERTQSGWTLRDHYNSSVTLNKIASDSWDYVVLQEEATGLAENQVVAGGGTEDRYQSVRDLYNYISAVSSTPPKVALFMTWRDKNSALSTYDALRGTVGGSVGYVPIAAELGIRVAPVGWAFRSLISANAAVDLWLSNNHQANTNGKYVAATTIYAALNAESAVGHYHPGTISDTDALTFTRAASDTTLNELPVWGIPTPTVWTVRPRVFLGEDDVTLQHTALTKTDSGHLQLGGYGGAGSTNPWYDFAARLFYVDIPKGVCVTSARLVLYPVSGSATGVNAFRPVADVEDNANLGHLTPPGILSGYLLAETPTGDVTYLPSTFSFPDGQYSEVPLPFESGVQLIVDRSGWNPRNAIRLELWGANAPGSGVYTFKSYNDNPLLAPFAKIEYRKNFRAVANARIVSSDANTKHTVSLSGSLSSDPDGDFLTYTWSLLSKPAGSSAVLVGASTITPTLVPDLKGTYTVQLVVNDGCRDSAPSTVDVVVTNSTPVANAGPDQSKHALLPFTLDGTGSSDADGQALSYSWTLSARPAGSSAALTSATTAHPGLTPDKVGAYTADLVVNDSITNSFSDQVVLNSTNLAPTARIQLSPANPVALKPVTLVGTTSSDPDSDPLTYSWSLTAKPAGSSAAISNTAAASPTLIPDKIGSYTVQLVVSDQWTTSSPSSATFSATNLTPVANAGPAKSAIVLLGTATLDGSGSSDPDGQPITYAWTLTSKPAGSTAVLSGATTVAPTLVPDKLGTYTAQLIVNDTFVSSAPASTTITATNTAPVANAGVNASRHVQTTVVLSGAGSSDPDGHTLTYLWSFVSVPSASAAALSGATSVSPSFVPDKLGAYTIQLVVNDGFASSPASTVTITATNTDPVANAGSGITLHPPGVANLQGTGTDADGDTLTYAWTLTSKPAGSVSALSGAATASPTLATDLPGTYTAQLIVSDAFASSTPSSVTITAVNSAPVANAGTQITLHPPGVASLHGTATDADGDTLSYQWVLSSRPTGSQAVLSGTGTANPTLAADVPGTYTAQLVVSDAFTSSTPSTVTISAINSAPAANAGDDVTIDAPRTATLHGSGTDADGDTLSFSWVLTSKPANSQSTLAGADTASPSLATDYPGTYVAELVVSDAFTSSTADTVVVTALDPALTAPTRLEGCILDANQAATGTIQSCESGSGIGVVGAVVSLIGYGSSVVTGPGGHFVLASGSLSSDLVDVNCDHALPPPQGSGNARYANFREGFKISPGSTNTLERPIFMPQITQSAQSTVVNDQATVVTNSALGIQMNVDPNAIRKADGSRYEGPLSISLVPSGFPPASLPPLLHPTTLITIQPVGLTVDPPAKISFPNESNLKQGSRVDIWSVDPNTGQFGIVGVGKVCASGKIKTISGGIRHTDWHFPAPPGPAGNPNGAPPPDGCKADETPTGSSTRICSGNLTEVHSLPSYRSMEQEHQLSFVYESTGADPELVLQQDATINAKSPVPDLTDMTVEVGGVATTSTVVTDTHALPEGSRQTIRQSAVVDARSAATGIYSTKTTLNNMFGTTKIGTEISGSVSFVNKSASPFGAGWSLAGLDRLYPQAAGRVLLEKGSGGSVIFTHVPQGELTRREPIFANNLFGTNLLQRLPVRDFTGDGIPDIAAVGDKIYVYRGLGGGAFAPTPIISPHFTSGATNLAGGDFATADFDGDSCPDIAAVGNNGGAYAAAFAKGTCDGHFSTSAATILPAPAEAYGGRNIVLADLDQNGTPDIIVGAYPQPKVIIWYSHASGGVVTFDSPVVLPLGPQYGPWGLVAADFDGDSQHRVDLAVTDRSHVYLFINSASGFLLPAKEITVTGPGGTGVEIPQLVAGDFNGDGAVDLALPEGSSAGANIDSLYILTNNGLPGANAGFFPNSIVELDPGTNPQSIDAADFDGDGNLDLVTGNGDHTLSILRGDGVGGFGLQTDITLDRVVYNVTVADVDGSGTPDVVAEFYLGSNTQIEIARNGFPGAPFEASRGDFSTLTQNPDQTYTRRLKDGTSYHFSAAGIQTDMTDRNGQVTSYLHDGGGRLTRITDPVGLQTNLTYSGAYLSSVTDPAGRTTSFGHDAGGNLTSITDPDSSTRGFTYDSSHRLVTQTSKRGFVTQYTYGLAGRNTGATRPDGSTVTVTPGILDRVADSAAGGGSMASPATVVPSKTVTARVTDGRGKVTTYQTDDFGAITAMTDPLNRTTTITRDWQSNPIVVVHPNGAKDLSTFDLLGNLVEKTEASGTTLARRRCYSYDSQFNRVLVATDPVADNGTPCMTALTPGSVVKKTQSSYDAAGNLLQLLNQANGMRQYTYNSQGNPLTFTDERGKTWSASYDQTTGNLSTVTDPVGAVTTVQRNAAGHATEVTEATGAPEERTTTIGYDAMNRVVALTDGSGVTVARSYDAAGNLETVELPTGETISREYDSRDRVSAVDDPRSGRTEYEYDGEGNVTLVRDALLNETAITYDDAGQVDTVTDARGGVQSYDFDSLGELSRVVDENNHATQFVQDLLGRKLSRSDTSGLTETYAYDLRDNVTGMTDRLARSFTYGYDALSRLTSIQAPANDLSAAETVTASYDGAGHLLNASDADTMVAFTYDAAGRLATETSSVAGSTPVTITSGYDLAGNRTSVSDSFGSSSARTYDGAGRLVSLMSATGAVVIDHDLSGRMSGILFPNDASSLFDYDASGRLGTITHQDGMSGVLASWTMGYNAVGSVETIGDINMAGSRSFGYDELQRLASETNGPAMPSLYGYDPAGNRTSSPQGGTSVYSPTNRLVSDAAATYAYDDVGELRTRTVPAGGQVTTFHWDSRGELTSVDLPGGGQAAYRYDALGRRVEKNAGGAVTRYVYDREDIALETDGSGVLKRRYRHGQGVDEPLVVEDLVAGQSYYLQTDHLGSVRSITDESGEEVSRYSYDAWGRPEVESEGFVQPYAFTGREWDRETGLMYYRARYYDSVTGRFLSEDPIGQGRGGLNLYRYALNAPLSWRDPLGLSPTFPPGPSDVPPDWTEEGRYYEHYPGGHRFRDPSGRVFDWHEGHPDSPDPDARESHWHCDKDKKGKNKKGHFKPGDPIPPPEEPGGKDEPSQFQVPDLPLTFPLPGSPIVDPVPVLIP